MTSGNRERSSFRNVQLAWVLGLAMTLTVNAQDPVKSLPDNYTREFENEYTRVTRVVYPAHAKLPAHAHTPLATAYVYLNDSGPVSFKHVGAEYGAVTRPPTVKGAFRVYRGLEEIHEVENLSERPSAFLRVEFKTDPVDPKSLRGKFLPEPLSAAPLQKIQFENGQVRITRLQSPARTEVTLAASSHPSLIVLLSEGEMGHTRWLPPGQSDSLKHSATGAREAIRIEFKTKPMAETQ